MELTCGDAVKLPYPPESLDAIFMSFTLELFDTPEIPKVLAECKRVLRLGGRIVVVGVSKEGEGGVILHLSSGSPAFPQPGGLPSDFCPPVLGGGRLSHREAEKKMMWVPVELVLAVKGA